MNINAKLHKAAYKELLTLLIESGVDEIKFDEPVNGYHSLRWCHYGQNLMLDDSYLTDDFYLNRNVGYGHEPIEYKTMFKVATMLRVWRKLEDWLKKSF